VALYGAEESATVVALSITDGAERWHRRATSFSVIQNGSAMVAVMRHTGGDFEAVDVISGTTLWRLPVVRATWAFEDALFSLRCLAPVPQQCELTRHQLANGAAKWRTPTLSNASSGVNPADFAISPIATQNDGSSPTPKYLGISTPSGLAVVATESGQVERVMPFAPNTRWIVAGATVIASTATWRDGKCVLRLDGFRVDSGALTWSKEGYDLHTVTGSGCQQDDPPTGGSETLRVYWQNHRQLLIDVNTGRELWLGASNERVLAVDDRTAVSLTDDGAVKCIDVNAGSELSGLYGSYYDSYLPGCVLVVGRSDGVGAYAVTEQQIDRIAWVQPSPGIVAVNSEGLVFYRAGWLSYVPFS
jgi:hypothetical protein